jgi:hypothetical protein
MQYPPGHAFSVRQHFMVPETNAAETERGKSCVPCLVGAVIGVLSTIHFDDKAGIEANEIDNMSFNRELATETQSLKALAAQHRP